MQINITNLNPKLSRAIQLYLIGAGYSYPSSGPAVQYVENKVMGIETDKKRLYNGGMYSVDHTIDATTEFARLVEIVSRPEPVSVRLNDSYKAVLEGDEVIVGCQRFPASKVLELAKIIEEAK